MNIMKANITLSKSIRHTFCSLLIILCSLSAVAQTPTLQAVTDVTNGNYTTKNIWLGMSPAAGVTEQALNVGGKMKMLGLASGYTLGTDANQPTIYRSGINTGTYPFNNYDHLMLQGGIQNRDIILLTGSTPTPRLVVTGSGNVGIGTATPTTLLNVNGGAIRLNNPGLYPYGINIDVNFPGGWAREFSISHSGTGKLFGWGVQGNGSSLVYAYIGGNTTADAANTAPWIAFKPDGNIGIGTTTPGTYKLAVEGTIGARKVKVTQTAWADFVFKPDYELRSLKQVENYIKENGHLPEIPSAKDVETEGLDVGEMNKKLLQKVEELTLYIIQLKKDSEAQQQMIQELKASINK